MSITLSHKIVCLVLFSSVLSLLLVAIQSMSNAKAAYCFCGLDGSDVGPNSPFVTQIIALPCLDALMKFSSTLYCVFFLVGFTCFDLKYA